MNSGYPFIASYFKGEESRLVTAEHIGSIAKSSGLDEVLLAIRNTDIGSYLGETSLATFSEADAALWHYFDSRLQQVRGFHPTPREVIDIIEVYIVKYDIFNIKAVLQGMLGGKKAEGIPLGVIYWSGLLEDLFSAKDVPAVVDIVAKARPGDRDTVRALSSVVGSYQAEDGVKSSILTDARLDELYYQSLMRMAKTIADGNLLTQAIRIMIDTANFKVVVRGIINGTGVKTAESVMDGGYIITPALSRELLGLKLTEVAEKLAHTIYDDMAEDVVDSYNSNKNRRAIDETVDKYRFRLVKGILSPHVLSPLSVVWYLLLKEVEIRDLRMILKTTFDNMPLEEIKTYLVLAS